MTKLLPLLDENRPAQSAGSDMVAWIRSLTVQLPKLSPMALQSEAFDHYDRSLRDGEPTAAKIAAGLMALPELDQKTAAARRSEWSRSRCVEYLRFEAARLNKELVEIAEKTKSEAIKVAVIDAIYGAILSSYPHLKAEAADMAVKRKLELAKGGKNGAAAMSQAAEPEVAPVTSPEASKTTLAGGAEGEADLVQIANTQLAALRIVHGYLVPLCAAHGITIDSQQAGALTMNMLIQAFMQRSHHKVPRAKLEGIG